MNAIIKDESIRCASREEFQSITEKLKADAHYAGIAWLCDTSALTIKYKTEEITPEYKGNDRTKVLLLFKNPHPDSVDTGLFFSGRHSDAFWSRLFEVDYNRNLLQLLNRQDWISRVADTLLSGKYDSPFLYYFRCLYPFPTRQFADLRKLFTGAPLTYKREMLDRSLIELMDYIKLHDIQHVIIFFYKGMELLGGERIVKATNFTKNIKCWIDQYLCHNDASLFWSNYIGKKVLKQSISNGVNIYFNMNTHDKNHGDHLPKRYFTYNLEFILKDILKNSPNQNRQ